MIKQTELFGQLSYQCTFCVCFILNVLLTTFGCCFILSSHKKSKIDSELKCIFVVRVFHRRGVPRLPARRAHVRRGGGARGWRRATCTNVQMGQHLAMILHWKINVKICFLFYFCPFTPWNCNHVKSSHHPHCWPGPSPAQQKELVCLDYSSRPGSGPSRPLTAMSHDTLRRVSSILFICEYSYSASVAITPTISKTIFWSSTFETWKPAGIVIKDAKNVSRSKRALAPSISYLDPDVRLLDYDRSPPSPPLLSKVVLSSHIFTCLPAPELSHSCLSPHFSLFTFHPWSW